MIDQFIQPRLEDIVPSKFIKSQLKNVPDDPPALGRTDVPFVFKMELLNSVLGLSLTPSSKGRAASQDFPSVTVIFPASLTIRRL